jgi:hypothetical protein
MNVFVNGKPLEVRVSAVASLQDILLQVENLCPMSQIVTSVILNGRTLESDWMQHAGSTYILAEDKLELASEDAVDLGRRAFVDSRGHLQNLMQRIADVADHFRMDDEAAANTHYVQCIDMLQAYFNVLQESTRLMGLPLLSLKAGDHPMNELMDNIGQKLSELIDIQKNRDWILLADMLEYELTPLLKQVELIY